MTNRKTSFGASRFTLVFPNSTATITGHAGETIYQSARRSGVRIIGACGGRGTCGTCRVQIVAGEIDDGQRHSRLPPQRRKETPWVRACQVMPKSDCMMEIAARSLAPVVRAEFDAGEAVEILPLDPAVVSRDFSVPQATLADNLSDLDRVVRALAAAARPRSILRAARQLPTAVARRRLVAVRAFPRR